MRDSGKRGLAIGFFDGVHLGHQAILAGASVAITFKNHPLSVLAPEKAPQMLMAWPDREAAIRACGVESVIGLEFTPAMAALEAEDFATGYIAKVDSGKSCQIRSGANWRFGRGGRGSLATLAQLGYEVCEVPYAVCGGEVVSSTRIRKALADGDLPGAAAMLGKNWMLSGTIVHGKGEGGKMGFPTVNILPDAQLVKLPHGVYECRYGGRKAVANYGIAPTFRERAWQTPVCEVHVIEGSGNRESGTGKVEMVRFLRPERQFASQEELKAQIRRDVDGILQSL
ncbi:MAG: hypothetical protein II909_04220 [Kiritimatiellae bacterium]|nr:hypothetical protein [Kiritimatiellia bacterium]